MRTFISDKRKPKEQTMKQAKDIMSANPACCTPEHNVQQAAEMMVKHDCGEIPVVESDENMKPVGVITDRDITCSAVARGIRPKQTGVRETMPRPPWTVT